MFGSYSKKASLKRDKNKNGVLMVVNDFQERELGKNKGFKK